MTNSEFELDEFDSGILGKPVAKARIHDFNVNLVEVDAFCEERNVAVIFLFIQHTRFAISGLFEHGFQYLTSKVKYTKDSQQSEASEIPSVDGIKLTGFDSKYFPQLLELVYVVGEKSRFYLDSNFTDKWRNAYREWAVNAIGGHAQKIILAISETDESVRGFIFLKQDKKRKSVSIDLIAVRPDSQGRGIGTVLLAAAEDWAISEGMQTLEVVTEPENIHSQRIYQSRGFKISDHTLVYSKSYGK
ncbi:GNAT family N-acetyltransferase [Candidatus Peregrinibacteria bacterium]|nr:GNAT family N-acetyltransferase [Candidatus Peregrinibacteria bacterium]